jgi:tetratricopeptide (TPR) repeat protein
LAIGFYPQKISLILVSKGQSLLSLERLAKAVEVFDVAAQWDSNDSSIYYWKGIALERLQLQNAAEAFKKALELDPKNIDAMNHQESVLRRLGGLESKET